MANTAQFKVRPVSAKNSKVNDASDKEGPISVGNVLELLLSATRLYKKATITRANLLVGKSETTETTNVIPPTNTGNQQATNDQKEVNLPAAEIWKRLLSNPASLQPEKAMKVLQDILDEGLLDSILPYVVASLNMDAPCAPELQNEQGERVLPTNLQTGKSVPHQKLTSNDAPKAVETEPKNRDDVTRDIIKNNWPDRITSNLEPAATASDSSSTQSISNSHSSMSGPPITIHVCDEAHGLRQDFTCPRDSLVQHIGYFAEVTAGQRLEDVDISVHCDVTIFEWLLKWVKKQQYPSEDSPLLEPKNSISILISADFLKMTPLVDEVLKYVHRHSKEILEAQVNLSCLSDTLLTRLSHMFTHWELENLKDPKDRLQNKLYQRFVQLLCDVNPQPSKGIFRTAATIYRCSDCGKIINRNVERMSECIPVNTYITSLGAAYYVHSRNINWNLTEHVRQLKNDLRNWRLVYWRLWGQVHFLPCSTCGDVFPCEKMRFCRFHRLEAAFGIDTLSPLISSSGDAYPCCGGRALKFSPLPLRNFPVSCLTSNGFQLIPIWLLYQQGCQYKEHTVQLTRKNQEIWGPVPQIYDDLLTFQNLICDDPPKYDPIPQKMVWKGVPILPAPRFDRSFLDRSWLGEHSERGTITVVSQENEVKQTKEEDAKEKSLDLTGYQSSAGNSDSSDDEEDGGTKKKAIPVKLRTTLMKKAARAKRAVAYEITSEPGWHWDSSRSTRFNQDAQRERETKILRELVAWLSFASPATPEPTASTAKGKNKSDKKKEHCSPGPSPGLYYQLEMEFKEKHSGQERAHGGGHTTGTFRAKVQAISRIKMRLRNRTAFSANR